MISVLDAIVLVLFGVIVSLVCATYGHCTYALARSQTREAVTKATRQHTTTASREGEMT